MLERSTNKQLIKDQTGLCKMCARVHKDRRHIHRRTMRGNVSSQQWLKRNNFLVFQQQTCEKLSYQGPMGKWNSKFELEYNIPASETSMAFKPTAQPFGLFKSNAHSRHNDTRKIGHNNLLSVGTGQRASEAMRAYVEW